MDTVVKNKIIHNFYKKIIFLRKWLKKLYNISINNIISIEAAKLLQLTLFFNVQWIPSLGMGDHNNGWSFK
jgi:hypothetical protein